MYNSRKKLLTLISPSKLVAHYNCSVAHYNCSMLNLKKLIVKRLSWVT